MPSWPAHAWLLTLALTSQVLGWLLITVSLPRLPAALTSVTLTIQPVGSVLLGVILLGEEPSGLQLVGVACILAGLLAIARPADPRKAVPSRRRLVADMFPPPLHELEAEVMEEVWAAASARSARCSTRSTRAAHRSARTRRS